MQTVSKCTSPNGRQSTGSWMKPGSLEGFGSYIVSTAGNLKQNRRFFQTSAPPEKRFLSAVRVSGERISWKDRQFLCCLQMKRSRVSALRWCSLLSPSLSLSLSFSIHSLAVRARLLRRSRFKAPTPHRLQGDSSVTRPAPHPPLLSTPSSPPWTRTANLFG